MARLAWSPSMGSVSAGLSGRALRVVTWGAATAALAGLATALPPLDGLLLGLAVAATGLLAATWLGERGALGPAWLFGLTSSLFIWARPLLGSFWRDVDLDLIEAMGGVAVSRAGREVYFHLASASLIAFGTTVGLAGAHRPAPSSAGDEPPRRGDTAGWRPAVMDGAAAARFWGWCFGLGAAAYLVQAALYARWFLQGGSYYELFVLGKEAVTFPGLSLAGSLLFLGYAGLLALAPLGDRARTGTAVLFGLVSLAGLARGSRGEVFAQLLVGVWLYFFTAGRRPRPLFWLLLLAALVLLAEGVSMVRSGVGVEERDAGLLTGLGWFVYSQGLSGELVAPAVEAFGVDLGNARFTLAPLLAPFRQLVDPAFGTQTDAYGRASGLLSHELSYRLDPDLYLAGHGVGSSYLAEAYLALGLVGVILSTAAVVWALTAATRAARTSRPALFLLACTMPYVLFIPRESLLFFVVPTLKAALLLATSGLYASLRKAAA